MATNKKKGTASGNNKNTTEKKEHGTGSTNPQASSGAAETKGSTRQTSGHSTQEGSGQNPGQHTESTSGNLGNTHPNAGSADRLVSREDSSKGPGYDGTSGEHTRGNGGGGAASQTPFSSAYSTIQVRQGQTYGSPTGNWSEQDQRTQRGSGDSRYGADQQRDWTEGNSAGQGDLRDEGNDVNQYPPSQASRFGYGQHEPEFGGQGSAGANWDSRNYGRGESYAMGNNYGRSTSQPGQGSGGLWGENKQYASQARQNQQRQNQQEQQSNSYRNQNLQGRYSDAQNPYMNQGRPGEGHPGQSRQQQGNASNGNQSGQQQDQEANWAYQNEHMQGRQRGSQAWGAYNMGGAYRDDAPNRQQWSQHQLQNRQGNAGGWHNQQPGGRGDGESGGFGYGQHRNPGSDSYSGSQGGGYRNEGYRDDNAYRGEHTQDRPRNMGGGYQGNQNFGATNAGGSYRNRHSGDSMHPGGDFGGNRGGDREGDRYRDTPMNSARRYDNNPGNRGGYERSGDGGYGRNSGQSYAGNSNYGGPGGQWYPDDTYGRQGGSLWRSQDQREYGQQNDQPWGGRYDSRQELNRGNEGFRRGSHGDDDRNRYENDRRGGDDYDRNR